MMRDMGSISKTYKISSGDCPRTLTNMRRLTPEDIRKIRRLHSQGVSAAALGERFGRSVEGIRALIRDGQRGDGR